MPVDVGAGKNSLVQPRDSRSLDIVHFTAELAPIAKVSWLVRDSRGWRNGGSERMACLD
jgi:hypothetical protein